MSDIKAAFSATIPAPKKPITQKDFWDKVLAWAEELYQDVEESVTEPLFQKLFTMDTSTAYQLFNAFELNSNDDMDLPTLIRVFHNLWHAFEDDGDISFVRATIKCSVTTSRGVSSFLMHEYFCMDGDYYELNVPKASKHALAHHNSVGRAEVVCLRARRLTPEIFDVVSKREAYKKEAKEACNSGIERITVDEKADRFYDRYLAADGKDGYHYYDLTEKKA